MKRDEAKNVQCPECGKFLGVSYVGSHSTTHCWKCGRWWVYAVREDGVSIIQIPPQEPLRSMG